IERLPGWDRRREPAQHGMDGLPAKDGGCPRSAGKAESSGGSRRTGAEPLILELRCPSARDDVLGLNGSPQDARHPHDGQEPSEPGHGRPSLSTRVRVKASRSRASPWLEPEGETPGVYYELNPAPEEAGRASRAESPCSPSPRPGELAVDGAVPRPFPLGEI